MANPLKIFISYSHADKDYLVRFITYLSNMKRQNEVSAWTDRQITAGNEWRNKIDENLLDADIVIILVSPDFVNSEYCYDLEMVKAIERHRANSCKIIPIYIRVTDVKGSIIEEFQALPDDRKPISKWSDADEAWKNVIDGLRLSFADYVKGRPMSNIVSSPLAQLEFSESHSQWLDDTEVTLVHRKVSKVGLSNIYVPPDLVVFTKNLNNRVRRSISSATLLSVSKFALVIGEEQSGKTSLVKALCIAARDSGKLSVYLKGSEIRSSDVTALIDRRISEQYSDVAKAKKVSSNNVSVFIDDLHLNGLNKKHLGQLLSLLKTTYATVTLLAKDTFRYIIPDHDQLDDFSLYQINDFGNVKRNQLIEKWVSLGVEESIEEGEMYRESDEISQKINSIIRKKLLPSKPIFLLSILQMLEAYTSQRLDMTSHGHCYQSLVYQALERIQVKQKEIDKYMNVLTELAWAQYQNAGNALTISGLAHFYDNYANEYLSVDRAKVTEDLLNCSILSMSDELVSFKYPYIYYFFTAKKIADSFSKSDSIKAEIKKLLDGLHREDYANIIIFITHHTKEAWILDEIEMCLMQLFSDNKAATLKAQDTFFLEEFIKDIPRLIIEEREVQKERQRHQQSLEEDQHNEVEDGRKLPEGFQDENDLFANINKVFKGSELIGQIVRNRNASLNKPELTNLLKEAYSCGLRFLQFFIDISDLAKEEVIQSIAQQIKENPSQTNLAIEKEAKSSFLFFTFSAIYAIIRKIASSTGCVEAEEIFRSIEEEWPTPAVKLINQAIVLDFHKRVDVEVLENLANEFKGNVVCDRILKEIVVQHIYMFPVDYKDKQRISEILKLPMEKLQLQDLDKSSKMIENKK
ncbi:TIR domain-containing protein [Pseudomonas yamanorum]|uniref:TIR domain-containing protein n=1 Tax=Pseudomonas yamanorum TaxID=515393 RepID=A0ABU1CVR8_9PSED|nr:TIR domain-containing protein [Pseudomonas yamanorum]MDR0191365.1 TIR domain-containing protein [Pseudomonas yamanorum]